MRVKRFQSNGKRVRKAGRNEKLKRTFLSSPFRLSVTLSCPLDLTLFPMDTQRCKMQLESCEFFFSNDVTLKFLISSKGNTNIFFYILQHKSALEILCETQDLFLFYV